MSTTGLSARDLLPTAAKEFGSRVLDVPDDGWDRPTPCRAWTVRDLVGHLVVEHLWAVELLEGATIGEVGSRFDGDVLDDDPPAAWTRAINDSMDAWAAAGVDDTVQLSSGERPVQEYAEEMLLDLTVHAWDLARGAGLSEDLDDDVVAHVLAYAQEHADELAGSGLFDDPVQVDSADPQAQLLALLGRRP
ncbi:MAG: TIGR03086 family metal-binding protein [Actinomycetota bacterium]|nr:TIGR03086 family metal-binding protein [Actinomycetota bacterium]